MKGKHIMLIAFIVNILIRIPRMLLPHGSDGFTAIWEAQLILRGEYFSNGFNIWTLLGLVPYSGYPIGILLILCFFLLIAGNNIIAATLLFDLAFLVIFVISSFYLAEELDFKPSTKLYFILFLTTVPNILSFSYYQTSSRFPFFAVLPLVLMLLLRFNKRRKAIPLIIAIGLSIILNFIHRMAVILFGIIALSVIFFLIEKWSKRDFLVNYHTKKIIVKEDEFEVFNERVRKRKIRSIKFYNYFKQRFWVFSLIGLVLLGFLVLGLNFNNVFFRSKFNVYCYIMAIFNCETVYLLTQPIVDQWFHYGTSFLLLLIGIILMLIPKMQDILDKINISKANLYLLFFTLFFIPVYQLIYSLYILSYVIAVISANLIESIENRRIRHYLGPISGLIVSTFIILYHFLTETKVLPYFILAIFIMSLSLISVIILAVKKLKSHLPSNFRNFYNKTKTFAIFFFIITIINSMFIVDRSILFTQRVNSIYEHLTLEEKAIAEFLTDNGFGTFESFDYTLSIHIAALSGWHFIQDQHNIGVFLLENRTVDEIGCNFTLFINWPNMELFNCNHTYGRQILYNDLFRTECYTYTALNILKRYNIQYFISSIHTNTSYAWQYTINSVFIESLYSYVPIVKTTENYFVWNTSTLYS